MNGLYLPSAHGVQEVAPAFGLYEPAAHVVQELAPAPEDEPASHVKHVLDDVAPEVDEYVPAEHEVHEVAPPPAEYVPGSQVSQYVDNGMKSGNPGVPCQKVIAK